MNLSELFIRRPVMTVLLNLGIVLAGIIAYGRIPVAALPSYNTPVINVSASLPGASPETMATSVALPLEKQFQTIPGLSVISSNNTLGNTSVTLEFEEGRDIDAAAVDVQAAPLHDAEGHVVLMILQRSMAQKIDRQLTHRGGARSVIGMASMLAHEIKNPLSGIRGAAQLLEIGRAHV